MTKTIDTVDNTTGVVTALECGNPEEIETLLGGIFKLRRKGVVRSGIMALKGGLTAKDQEVYDNGVKRGLDWDEIDKSLNVDKNGKSKLVPKNADYFTIHPKDCTDPRDIETIYKLYADPDGKLRSFPVWFAVNEWWKIIPHSLRCFSASGLKFKGVLRDGKMFCQYPLPSKPGKKKFGGRDWKEKPCNPDDCQEFQKGECSFGGVIQFYIPGIKGTGIWVLPTRSWHSLASIKSNLELVHSLIGRCSGLFDGKPFFRLRKVLETMYRPNPDGTRTKTKQWIITLDTDLDMMEIARYMDKPTVASRAQIAAGALNSLGIKAMVEPGHPRTVDGAGDAGSGQAAAGAPEAADPSTAAPIEAADNEETRLQKARDAINGFCREEKLTADPFVNYARKKYVKELTAMNASEVETFTKDVMARFGQDREGWIKENSASAGKDSGRKKDPEKDRVKKDGGKTNPAGNERPKDPPTDPSFPEDGSEDEYGSIIN